jgi:ankyrin repeat protein
MVKKHRGTRKGKRVVRRTRRIHGGDDPLHVAFIEALKKKDILVIKTMLDNNKDLVNINIDGKPLISRYITSYEFNIVDLLLEYDNINVNALDYLGYTPLFLALDVRGDLNTTQIKIVKKLLEKGAQYRVKNTST